MASVSLEQVSKRYRDVDAVRDLSLRVPDGDLLTMVGPSGCGKTTVLRLIAGLEVPDGGTIRFDDRDVSGLPPRDRNVAMVFEGYALYPHMAVRDNLAFALRLKRTPGPEIERRVADVTQAMELGHLLPRRPDRLASGEAQHVAVGRAIVRDTPAVMLLDDALSHLDARQRLEARTEIGHLHRDLGCTIVAVTHDQEEALAIGRHVAVMDAGELMQLGTPQQLYERPANTFVAGFIGSPPMNLVEMRLEGHGDQALLRADALEVAVPRWLAVAPGSAVTMGIRPREIRLGLPTGTGEVAFHGRCELVEYLGPRVLLHLRIGAVDLIAIDGVPSSVRVGDTVGCAVALEHLHLFETATGSRLN